MNAGQISIDFVAGLSDFRQGMNEITRSISGLGTMLATTLAGFGIAAIGSVTVAIDKAADLEEAVRNIASIKPELDITGVSNAISKLTSEVGGSSLELANAMYNIVSSIDVTTEQALELTRTFAKGARAASTDTQTFGTAVLGVLNSYGMELSEAEHITDVFFNTVNRGVINGKELASSLGPVTAAAKAAGVGLDELGALIVGVTKEGGDAAQNVNNLVNVFAHLTTSEAQNHIHELGVATVDAEGKFRPFIDVLSDLKPRLDAMTESQRAMAIQKIFPDIQARQGMQVLLNQLDTVQQAMDDNINTAGSTQKAFETMSAGFRFQLSKLSNVMTDVLTRIGTKLLPMITPFITMLGEKIPAAVDAAMAFIEPFGHAISALSQAIREDSGALGVIGDLIESAFGPTVANAVRPFLEVMMSVIDVVKNLVAAAQSAMSGDWDFAKLLFHGAVEGANTALSQLVDAVKNLGQMVLDAAITYIPQIATAISGWVAESVPAVLAALPGIVNSIAGWINGAISQVKNLFEQFAPVVWDWITNAASMAGEFLYGLVYSISQWAVKNAPIVGEQLKVLATQAWDWIGTAVDNAATFLGGLIKSISDWASAHWQEVGTAFVDLATGAWNWLVGITGQAATELGKIVTAIYEWAKDKGPKVAEALSALAEGGLMLGAGIASKMVESLPSIITAIKTWAAGNATSDDMKATGHELGGAFAAGFAAGAAAPQGEKSWNDKIVDALNSMGDNIQPVIDAIGRAGAAFVQLATTAVEQIGKISEAWSRLLAVIGGQETAASANKIGDFLLKIAGILQQTNLQSIVDTFNNITAALSALNTVLPSLGQNITDRLDAISSSVIRIEDAIKKGNWAGAIQTLAQLMTKELDNQSIPAAQAATKLGNAVVDGFIAPIKGRKNEAAAAGKELANATTGAMADALKAHSPSKVAEKLGESVGDGFEAGVSDNISAMSDVGEQMGQAAASGVAEGIKSKQDEVTAQADTLSESILKAQDTLKNAKPVEMHSFKWADGSQLPTKAGDSFADNAAQPHAPDAVQAEDGSWVSPNYWSNPQTKATQNAAASAGTKIGDAATGGLQQSLKQSVSGVRKDGAALGGMVRDSINGGLVGAVTSLPEIDAAARSGSWTPYWDSLLTDAETYKKKAAEAAKVARDAEETAKANMGPNETEAETKARADQIREAAKAEEQHYRDLADEAERSAEQILKSHSVLTKQLLTDYSHLLDGTHTLGFAQGRLDTLLNALPEAARNQITVNKDLTMSVEGVDPAYRSMAKAVADAVNGMTFEQRKQLNLQIEAWQSWLDTIKATTSEASAAMASVGTPEAPGDTTHAGVSPRVTLETRMPDGTIVKGGSSTFYGSPTDNPWIRDPKGGDGYVLPPDYIYPDGSYYDTSGRLHQPNTVGYDPEKRDVGPPPQPSYGNTEAPKPLVEVDPAVKRPRSSVSANDIVPETSSRLPFPAPDTGVQVAGARDTMSQSAKLFDFNGPLVGEVHEADMNTWLDRALGEFNQMARTALASRIKASAAYGSGD